MHAVAGHSRPPRRQNSTPPPSYSVKIVAGRKEIVYDRGEDSPSSKKPSIPKGSNFEGFKPIEQFDYYDPSKRTPRPSRPNNNPNRAGGATNYSLHNNLGNDLRDKYNVGKGLRPVKTLEVNKHFLGIVSKEKEPQEEEDPETQRANNIMRHSKSESSLSSARSRSGEGGRDSRHQHRRGSRRASRRRNRSGSRSPPVVRNLNETYVVLPSVAPREFDLDDRELLRYVQSAVGPLSDRTLDKLIIDMRKHDRDRDRVMNPVQLKVVMEKHKMPIMDVLDQLQSKFADQRLPGNTNYEDLCRYLHQAKAQYEAQVKETRSMEELEQHGPLEGSKRKHHHQRRQDSEFTPSRSFGSTTPFDNRLDAGLILELEKTLLNSPKFDLNRFRATLEENDQYGNDQVSKQHVKLAASRANLEISNATLGQLLLACDTARRNIYNIKLLTGYLERSDPHLLESRRQHSASSKLNSSCGSTKSTRSLPPPAPSIDRAVTHAVPAWEARKPLMRLDKSTSSLPSDLFFSPISPTSPKPQNLEDLGELRQALEEAYQDVEGYLSMDDIRHVCRTYNTAYAMNISDGRVHEAIGNAKSMDPANGHVNVRLFLRFLDEAVRK